MNVQFSERFFGQEFLEEGRGMHSTDVADKPQQSTERDMQTSPAAGAMAASLATIALLAGCGGGDAPPAAMLSGEAAVAMPQLMGAGSGRHSVSMAATRLPTADELMDWGERQFPSLFPSHAPTQTSDALLYRFYPGNSTYLGVLNGDVLVLGPVTGGQVATVGRVADFADQVFSEGTVANDEAAARFLHQAAFGASDADIAAVRNRGYSGWLNDQLNMPVGQTKWDWLVGKGYTAINDRTFFFSDNFYQFAIWHDMFTAPDMVRKRWALALSELFVTSVSSIGGSLNWAGFAGTHYWDTLTHLGLGNFRDLLEAVTLHPAIGAFLNTRGNQKEDPGTGRVPDENYAREVMQLFTIGLHQLHLDGTPVRGANGQPVDSYSQADVTNLARVFTGYDIDTRGIGKVRSPVSPYFEVWRPEYLQRPMWFDASKHSSLEKRFLGTTIAAGTPGPAALATALDTLFNHPNVGPFFARQMIQRLVTSNPEPAYVARVAAVFNDNGAGVRGDLKSVLRAILLDDAARAEAGLGSRTFGKLREPMFRIANWGRAFKVRSLAGTWKFIVGNWDPESDLQQVPLNAPSVFNFYRPGYVPPSTEMAVLGATAPEFQLVSESSVSGYLNYLQGILAQGIWVGNPAEAGFPNEGQPVNYQPDIVPDYSAEFALVGDTRALVRRLNLLLAAGQLSLDTQNFIVNALRIDHITADANAEFKRYHVARAVLFVMASAEYLIKK
jgi:uncharacterized protein (DUF1800 family)